MGWMATERHGLATAPAGLGFVQDFLNTRPTHPAPSAKPEPAADLLADLDSAQRWLDGALQSWSQETGVAQGRVLLTEAELDKVRSLRADLASLLRLADRPRDVTLLPSAFRCGWEPTVPRYSSRAATEAAGSARLCSSRSLPLNAWTTGAD
jgi:hypothetical protein